MLFADVPLAARIDRAEASRCAALAAGGSGGQPAGAAILVVPVSGGLAVCGKIMGVGWSHA